MISFIFLGIWRIWPDWAEQVRLVWSMRRLVKPRQNTRRVYWSVVFTSTKVSMRENHLRTRERSLSVVKSIPANWVSTLVPWTSSHLRSILRKAWSSSWLRSAREHSKMRPLRPSEAILVPWVRVTRVLPTCLTVNMEGALTSYHSFLRKGSTAFFLPPFLPLDMRLFLPTAMVTEGCLSVA